MRRLDKALSSVGSNHRQENYMGPLASTDAGGHKANVNNLCNSQVRNAKTVMPYGVSSRAPSGMKAQSVVNDNSDSVVVGVYDPKRPQVGTGEVCLYSAGGCTVYLLSTGIISIESGNCSLDVSKESIKMCKGDVKMEIESKDVTIECGDSTISINSTGGITIDTKNKINMKSTEDITVETEGKIGVTAVGDITIATEGKTDIQSTGDTSIKSNGSINMEATNKVNMTCGELVVNGSAMMVP